ncbi:hypothetical protein, partial [Streptococcus pneumoniae]|uniref:hypothetical protein n=1 Tax=Streptococcus pneumoniae TaxID=1313 RepID=UPI001E294D82
QGFCKLHLVERGMNDLGYNIDGSMATGWVQVNDSWYYLNSNGSMKVNQWFQVGGKWYYVNTSGELAVNTSIDGYRVNDNGEWVR